MLLPANAMMDERWENLQQPIHPSQVEPQFRSLLAALDMGWRIEEPVYLRPRWSEVGPRVYHFILRRSLLASPRLLSVPEGPQVDHLIRDEGLRLVVGR